MQHLLVLSNTGRTSTFRF
uniref:Uncharacterized protein n=1 Tax=Arundo donax TaxID=35708 RepID=A0A0A9CU59_ARUDO